MDENAISLTSAPDSLLPSNINKNNLEVEMTSKFQHLKKQNQMNHQIIILIILEQI